MSFQQNIVVTWIERYLWSVMSVKQLSRPNISAPVKSLFLFATLDVHVRYGYGHGAQTGDP